jgi:hypothetical protein
VAGLMTYPAILSPQNLQCDHQKCSAHFSSHQPLGEKLPIT